MNKNEKEQELSKYLSRFYREVNEIPSIHNTENLGYNKPLENCLEYLKLTIEDLMRINLTETVD